MLRAIAMSVICGLAGAATEPEEVVALVKSGQYAVAREKAKAELDGSQPSSCRQRYFLFLLGLAERSLGGHPGAVTVLKTAAQITGCVNPSEMDILVTLAAVEGERGDSASAERTLLRLRRETRAKHGPESVGEITIANELGLLYWTSGQWTKAAGELELACVLAEKLLGPESETFGSVLTSFGTFLGSTGKEVEAIPMLKRSQGILVRLYGPAHAESIRAAFGLGTATTRLDPSAGERILREALDRWLESQPHLHPTSAHFLNELAWCRMRQKDAKGAAELNEKAIRIERHFRAAHHPEFVALLRMQVRFLEAAGIRKQAGEVRKELARIEAMPGFAEPAKHRVDVKTLRMRK